MTKSQKTLLTLAKKFSVVDCEVSNWDLQMRGIALSTADALVRKGLLNKTSTGYSYVGESS